MKLKRIELHNYKQHRDLEVEFGGSLIGLIGPNGCGKSNFLGALQFALTGEQPPYKKSELLAWRSDEGAVTLEFEANGTPCRVTRTIKKNSATLVVGDTTITGTAKVNEEMDRLLGVDKDLLRQSVFVQQAQLDAVLFTEPRARELAFQRLMGLGDVDKIYRELGVALSAYDQDDGLDEELKRTQEALATADTKLSEETARVNDLRSRIAALPSEEDLKARLADIKTRGEGLATELAVAQQRAGAVIRRDAAMAACRMRGVDEADVQKNLDSLKSETAEILRVASRADKAKASAAAVVAARAAFTAASAEFENSTAAEDAEKAEKESSDLMEAIARAEGELASLKRLDVPAGTTKCPLCGSTADHDLHADIQARMAAVGNVQEMCTRRREAKRMADSLKFQADNLERGVRQAKATLDTSMAAWNTALSELPKECEGIPPEQAEKMLDSVAVNGRKLAEEHNAKISEMQEVLDKSRAASADLAAAESLLASLPEGRVPDVITADLQAARAEYREVMNVYQSVSQVAREMAGAEAGVEHLRNEVASAKEAVSRLVERQALQESRKARVDRLRSVRDWFHYSNGPHTLSVSVMDALNDSVNKFLGEFTAPFTVEPSSEGIGFKVRFSDGRQMPAEGLPDATVLSGGQKAQLAVAFRLATYCTFAGRLGLLVLDEPTAYLDDANVACFGELMSKVSQIARNLGVQIVVATHERSILQYCSSVVDLSGVSVA